MKIIQKSDIVVEYQKPFFTISFPYNERDLFVVRNLPVRSWDKLNRVWKVPELAVKTLEHLPGWWTPEAEDKKAEIEKGLLELVDYKFVEQEEVEGTQLRPYQIVGSQFLQKAKRALLADDMGLGKTIQSITALIEAGCQKNLILCPATLKGNWAFQFQKHFDLEPEVVKGNKEERAQLWNSDNRFIVANYDLLLRDWDSIPEHWDGIIADELVFLKNYKSRRTRLAKRLKAEYKFGLSGLPVENNLMEFHSMMEWVRPEILPSWYQFKKKYVKTNFFGAITGYHNLAEVHMLTSPFILRRTKDEVEDELPDKIYTDFPLTLDAPAQKAYATLRDNFLVWLREQDRTQGTILEQLIRLRQFVEFPSSVGYDVSNVKMNWLEDIYAGTDKLVVFSYFKDSVYTMADKFQTKYALTGDVPAEDRLPMVQAFNNSKEQSIMLCTDAGRFGLDMIGAATIVHFGYFFNPATMIQREDRLHRKGQTRTVNVLRPYIEDTIDVGIRNIYMQRLAEDLDFMDGSEKMSALKLSKRDFERMVQGL